MSTKQQINQKAQPLLRTEFGPVGFEDFNRIPWLTHICHSAA